MIEPDFPDLSPFQEEMAFFPPLEQQADRFLAVLSWLTRICNAVGCEPPILVGCAAVEIYTEVNSSTGNLDLIASDPEKIGAILLRLGFHRSTDQRYWYNETHNLLLEFPATGLYPGEKTVSIRANGVNCRVISPEDLIIDRLETFEAVGDGTDLVYSYLCYSLLNEYLDMERLEENVRRRDTVESYKFIKRLLRETADGNLSVKDQAAAISMECRRRIGE
ncbi:MAG: DUF6036 family nucleotidyltransferase [bacterium]